MVYLSLDVALRVVGRRETGMELSDILMIVLISEGVGHGIEHVQDVKVAYLEPNGELSVIKRDTDKGPDAPKRKSPVV